MNTETELQRAAGVGECGVGWWKVGGLRAPGHLPLLGTIGAAVGGAYCTTAYHRGAYCTTVPWYGVHTVPQLSTG